MDSKFNDVRKYITAPKNRTTVITVAVAVIAMFIAGRKSKR